ncbi:MarR family transcriptional regulator [Chelativorans sp.]|uniref:MarR family winged helix-turn-helix transcriptional regulator n=1 Tax=Chelativorans sp. TaxID=2203393 RepID=UPI00281218CA|nr:MarR family transcriptional regulator [Chelativorans sp.]
MTKRPNEATTCAWISLMRTQRLALSRVEARLKEAKLPPLSWYDVLWELEKAGDQGLRPYELEKALLFAQYNLSRLAERLAAAGLIDRHECSHDRRGQVLKITARGRALRRDTWAVYAQAIEDAVGARLSTEEAETLAVLLKKLQ